MEAVFFRRVLCILARHGFEDIMRQEDTGKPGAVARVVHLEPPDGGEQSIGQLPSIRRHDLFKHVLTMLKGGSGLKDALAFGDSACVN